MMKIILLSFARTAYPFSYLTSTILFPLQRRHTTTTAGRYGEPAIMANLTDPLAHLNSSTTRVTHPLSSDVCNVETLRLITTSPAPFGFAVICVSLSASALALSTLPHWRRRGRKRGLSDDETSVIAHAQNIGGEIDTGAGVPPPPLRHLLFIHLTWFLMCAGTLLSAYGYGFAMQPTCTCTSLPFASVRCLKPSVVIHFILLFLLGSIVPRLSRET